MQNEPSPVGEGGPLAVDEDNFNNSPSLFEKPCLCTQHKTQITIYNPLADEQREYAAEGKIRCERIFHALFFFAGGGDTQYDGRNNGCNERCEKYAFYAERKPARSHKFYVAESHCFFFENEPRDKIKPAEEHDGERKPYKARFPIDVSFIEKAGYSTDNGYKHRHTVGNVTVFCVDQRGDDERRGNEHTRNRIHIAEIFRQVRKQRPQNRVNNLKNERGRGNMRLTIATFSAKHNIRNYGNVIVKPDLFAARIAMRGLCGDILAGGQTTNEHPRKTTEARAEYKRSYAETYKIKFFHTHADPYSPVSGAL